MRKVVAAGVCVLFLIWLPVDIQSIKDGLAHEPRLALGISLKLLMHLLAIWGLIIDKTFGYAFLLGATLQGSLVAYGAIKAIPPDQWTNFKGQMIRPFLDLAFRAFCLLFILSRPGRLVGKEAAK